ncbi:thioredoxin domain-containing protein [Alkalicoccobacillus murimartini]|uniref:Thioredoxin domain-containing protein n=1 Tax=Alkalicoccobacillus murimartini TaxID=171685 RepID=A0ABT9YFM6_9BACI|nr:hypothetical protein [Alkalicoccobacillus murimartini]MDQ0206499.1 hypothetical protein [Alkalicoccobacillus murimartini]
MNKWLIIMSACALLLLTSCIAASTSPSSPLTNDDDEAPIAVLFSDADNPEHEQEANYYDALLELTSDFPDEMPELVIVDASDEEKVQYYDINQFPTILCLDGEEISLRIEGTNNKEDILKHFSNLFNMSLKMGLAIF